MAKVDLITGFLGVGKTTFIKEYIKWLKSEKITFAVIENEFGEGGIDSEVLNLDCDKVSDISGGCICCTQKVNFATKLMEYGEKYERVIVEPSGVFSPKDFIELMESTVVKKSCEYGFIAVVIDPTAKYEDNEDDMFKNQIYYANTIIISKVQLCDSSLMKEFKHKLFKEMLDKFILSKNFCEITNEDFQSLKNNNYFYNETKMTSNYVIENHAILFNSIVIRTLNKFEIGELKIIIEKLFSEKCGNISRIKGFLNSDDDHVIFVNSTKNNIYVELLDIDVSVKLNIIGRNLKRKNIYAIFGSEY